MARFSMQDSLKDSNNHKAHRITGSRRKGSLQGWIFCLSLLVLGALAGQAVAAPAGADPNKPRQATGPAELSERLEELLSQLRQERSDYYVQKARLEARIEKVRENRKILQDELNDLRRQEVETDQQIGKYEAEVEDLRKQLGAKASLENVLDGQVQPFLVSQRIAIEEGIPYKRQERTARLEAAVGDTNTSSITAADRLGHIWNYAQEELRLARSPETYTARAKTEDDSSPYARFFRVGLKILGYMTEDGRQAAMWSSLPGQKGWRFITDVKQSGQIRSAVEILDRRQGPKLVTLPVTLQSAHSQEGDSDASP